MADKSEWQQVLGFTITSPAVKRQSGRPKQLRYKGPLDPRIGQRMKICKRCGLFSHHARRCKEPIGSQFEGQSTSRRNAIGGKRKRASRQAEPSPHSQHT